MLLKDGLQIEIELFELIFLGDIYNQIYSGLLAYRIPFFAFVK